MKTVFSHMPCSCSVSVRFRTTVSKYKVMAAKVRLSGLGTFAKLSADGDDGLMEWWVGWRVN